MSLASSTFIFLWLFCSTFIFVFHFHVIGATHTDDIHDLLPQYGFPKGLIPNNVASYTLSSTGFFTIHLQSPCYVHFSDQLVYYHTLITGTLTHGSVSGVSGIQAKKLFLWLSVTGINIDSDMLEFFVGSLSQKVPANQFQRVPGCSPKACKGSATVNVVLVHYAALQNLAICISNTTFSLSLFFFILITRTFSLLSTEILHLHFLSTVTSIRRLPHSVASAAQPPPWIYVINPLFFSPIAVKKGNSVAWVFCAAVCRTPSPYLMLAAELLREGAGADECYRN